jgi:hypothetical protein
MVLYDDEEARHIQVVCDQLALSCNAQAVFVLDMNGQRVARSGETDNVIGQSHVSIVAQRLVLVVLYDDRSSLGLVRLRVRQASDELTGMARGW